jgi:transcription elongation factor Elf1
MWFRFAWASVWRQRTIADGSFVCPHCNAERNYELVEYRRWIAFFSAPVIKLKDWYRRVRCGVCGREFEDFVLDVRPTTKPTFDSEENSKGENLDPT